MNNFGYGLIAFPGAEPYGIAFSFDQAYEVFMNLPIGLVLLIDAPRCVFATTVVDAKRFFDGSEAVDQS